MPLYTWLYQLFCQSIPRMSLWRTRARGRRFNTARGKKSSRKMHPLIGACNLREITRRDVRYYYTMRPRLWEECRGGCKLASFLAKLIPRPWQSGAPIWHGWKILDWLAATFVDTYSRSRTGLGGLKKTVSIGRPRFGTRSLERDSAYAAPVILPRR